MYRHLPAHTLVMLKTRPAQGLGRRPPSGPAACRPSSLPAHEQDDRPERCPQSGGPPARGLWPASHPSRPAAAAKPTVCDPRPMAGTRCAERSRPSGAGPRCRWAGTGPQWLHSGPYGLSVGCRDQPTLLGDFTGTRGIRCNSVSSLDTQRALSSCSSVACKAHAWSTARVQVSTRV